MAVKSESVLIHFGFKGGFQPFSAALEVGVRHFDADSLIAFLHSGQHGSTCPRKGVKDADISTTEVYARIDAEMKRKVFEEKVPNYTPNTTMPWEEDEDLLQWLTQFGKKTF